MSTFIIAEAGVNHNGDLDLALQLIDVAVRAGADAVKFQTFKADRLVTADAAKVRYQVENMGADGSQAEMLRRLELSINDHKEICAYCKKKDIIFLSTPFDEESVDMLDGLGIVIFKIPSGEITNKHLIQHTAKKRKPIILSTGMSYLDEVEKAVGWVSTVWDNLGEKPQLTLLHCVSSYPAAVEDSNLLAMKTLGQAFGLPVGYSDHTMGIEVSIAAAAMGASVIEKHFTLDRNLSGPDHKASLEPDELKAMVLAIRNVERALGDGVKRPTQSEDDVRNMARRSLVAARNIKENETISPQDIVTKRPGVGIPPEFKDAVVGRRVRKDISFDTLMKWEYLEDA